MARQQLVKQRRDIGNQIRAFLRGFGYRVGQVRVAKFEARVRELLLEIPDLYDTVDALLMVRRSINQGATIRAADLRVMPMSFSRLDKLGVDDTALAIGQRAKRFVPAGTMIEPAMLESVPLVRRGQLVTMTSTLGTVQVKTTAKAAQAGRIGEVIKVRAVDNKRVEFDVTIVGPGAVEIGSVPGARGAHRLALGDQP